MTRGRALGLAAGGALLLVLTGLGLVLQRADDLDGFVAVALAQGAVYGVAAALVWRGGGSRRALLAILAAAAAMRLAVLAAPPYLSTDIYRYIWDGRVQGAGVNPYRYIPVDPHLAPLRDTAIFPDVNRNTYAPTIYPPLAEAFFFLVTCVSQSLVAMKAAMVLCEAIAILLLLQLLRERGLPRERILLYAWHPLPLWEFAGSGHVDALVVLLLALALWGWRRLPQWLLGVVVAGLALVKFFPAVVAPALWRRRDWKLPAGLVAGVLLGYLPYLGVGWKVLGFLGGYAGEEGFNRGGAGFYLWELARAALPLAGASAAFYMVGAAALLALLGALVAFGSGGRQRPVAGAALLATGFTVLLSPHYPWYFAWLAVFPCLLPWRSLLWLTVASFLLYLVPVKSHIVAGGERLAVESAIYLPFAALVLFDLSRRRFRVPERVEG